MARLMALLNATLWNFVDGMRVGLVVTAYLTGVTVVIVGMILLGLAVVVVIL
jgi:hypothetical protein